jgi:spore coat polysaccharide biosynthesis protein SpsF (cytidylyltransferase family)
VITGAIVQARTSSSRLPGKVLREVAGKPLLQYLLERLANASLSRPVVVATSSDASDDDLAAFCDAFGVDCHRGPLDDVAQRMLEAAETRGLDAFVRVSGDSPLLDSALVDRAVELLRAGENDLVTNVHPRTFPHGQSVEALRTSAFRRMCSALTEPHDREHVTRYIYRHADEFRIASFTHDPDISALQLAVDTPEDLARFESILSSMTRPHWRYDLDGVVALARTT